MSACFGRQSIIQATAFAMYTIVPKLPLGALLIRNTEILYQDDNTYITMRNEPVVEMLANICCTATQKHTRRSYLLPVGRFCTAQHRVTLHLTLIFQEQLIRFVHKMLNANYIAKICNHIVLSD